MSMDYDEYSMLLVNTTYIYKMDSIYQVNTISWENQVKSERWSVPQAIDFTEATGNTQYANRDEGTEISKGQILWPMYDVRKGAVVSCIASKDPSRPVYL